MSKTLSGHYCRSIQRKCADILASKHRFFDKVFIHQGPLHQKPLHQTHQRQISWSSLMYVVNAFTFF